MPLTATVTCYPNNEVRSRLAPPRPLRPHVTEVTESCDRTSVQPEVIPTCDDEYKYLECSETLSMLGSPILDISSDFQTQEVRGRKPGYGAKAKPTRFGVFAKRKLQRIGGVIDKIVPHPTDGLFFTGTLPGSTLEAFNAIADWSGYVVNCLKSWVGKRVPSKMDFYVWERQKRGALHLHYYVYVESHSQRYYLFREFKREWIRILDSVCVASGVDLYARGDGYTHASNKEVVQAPCQFVEKSVAAYLSKYCSKDSSKHSYSHSHLHCPSRWWGCSRMLGKKLDEMTIKYVVEFASPGKARAAYEDLASTLERWSIKGYRYGDKVGYGLNHVFYYSPGESEYVMSEVSRTFVPPSFGALPRQSAALAELLRVLEAISGDEKLSKYIFANLSKSSTKVIEEITLSRKTTCGKAYALSSEIYMLTTCYINSRGYALNLWSRVRNRCNTISVAFSSPFLVNDEVIAQYRSV